MYSFTLNLWSEINSAFIFFLFFLLLVSSDQPDGGPGAAVHQKHPRERSLCGL